MARNDTVPLSTITRYITLHCPTAGDEVADLYALEAVREFCRRSQFAHRDVTIYGANGATDFEVPVPEGVEIVKIQRVYQTTGCNTTVDVTNRYGFRAPSHLYALNPSCLESCEDTTLHLVVSVTPVITAQDLPAEVESHAMAIASGAVAKLVMLPSQMHGNSGMKAADAKAAMRSATTLNAHHTKIFEAAIRDASHDRVWGQIRHNRGLTGKGFV
jgi:hypothetical protein